ncbi:MAG: BTAD domain-containing putative transcriptional regulator [Chloroflexota bacterium]
MLFLSLLGSFEARIGERPLTHFGTKKAQALLIYLAVQNQHVHQREALMSLFWPDSPLKSVQQNLRQTLYQLQKALQPEVTDFPLVLSERYTIRVNPEVPLAVDVAQFEVLSASPCKPSDWQTAVSLYRGEFLTDFFLPDCDPFEEWAAAKRAFYQRRAQEVLHGLAEHYMTIGELAAAETAVRRQLALDNLQENAHRQLMKILAENGRRQEALTHYDTLRKLLHDDLAVEPEPETISLVEAIRAGEPVKPLPVSSHQPAHKLDPPRHNLPKLLTSFIGREKEMEEIADLVARYRLVTLTGVGGIGKTTLSTQVGHKLLDTFTDGVWLVELAPIANPDLVPQTIAYTLGLWVSSNRPILDVLLDFLREKKCLIILDNCEHLIQATAQFARVSLQTCPHLKILATSREILDVPWESLFYVPPLSTPEIRQFSSLDHWHEYEAMRLFVDRAAMALSGFQVTPDNIQPLAQICQRLDGIPLALELAAARVKILTTDQIAARLDSRFRLLSGGSYVVLPRHQTLKALVDWSWDLLSNAEQELLQRLSVFSGNIKLEAVEAVCMGDGLDADDLLDLLTALVKKSLVIARREQGEETRFRLLETIRQYAQERLEAASEADRFRKRHLDYFKQLAVQAEKELARDDQVAWMKLLERELDNIRTALIWARENDVESGLRITTALWLFWDNNYECEGEEWLAQLLPLANSVPPALKSRALWMRGRLNYYQGKVEYAHDLIKESITLSRKSGDQQELALGLHILGATTINSGEGQPLLMESLALFRSLEDKLGIAEVLSRLAGIEENHEQAVLYLEEGESLYREAGHLAGIAELLCIYGGNMIHQENFDFEFVKHMLEEALAIEESLGSIGMARSLMGLGNMYFRAGKYRQAYEYLERSLSISHQTGDRLYNYWAYNQLGYVLLRMGKINQAQEIFVKNIEQFKEVNIISGVVCSVEGLASLATHLGQFDRAVRLYAWADATLEITQDRRPRAEQADVDRDMAILQERMGKEVVVTAYTAGKLMTIEQVIASELPLEFAYS